MLYTLTGKNSFGLSKHLEDTISAFIKEHGELALERLDASEKEVDDLLQAAQNLPFLADRKLVIIKNANANQAALERLDEFVERTPESVDVYFVDQTFDKRKSSYKDLQKQTKLTEFREEKPQDVSAWIQSHVNDQGGTISRTDAQFLVDRVGSSQLMLSQEIHKLLLHDPAISRKSIQHLTDESLQSTIFSLLDAAFTGDQRAIELYQQQRQAKVEPSYIIAMLTWQLQGIALALYADPQTEATLVQAGQSPFTARKSIRLAQKTSKRELQQLVGLLSELDAKTKSSAVDPDAALELFLLELTTS